MIRVRLTRGATCRTNTFERASQSVADENADVDWLDRELGDCAFNDERPGKRFRSLLQSTMLLSDPPRSVHIGDRESDIYEPFCTVQDTGTHFLLRTCVDRFAGDGTHTIAAKCKKCAAEVCIG